MKKVVANVNMDIILEKSLKKKYSIYLEYIVTDILHYKMGAVPMNGHVEVSETIIKSIIDHMLKIDNSLLYFSAELSKSVPVFNLIDDIRMDMVVDRFFVGIDNTKLESLLYKFLYNEVYLILKEGRLREPMSVTLFKYLLYILYFFILLYFFMILSVICWYILDYILWKIDNLYNNEENKTKVKDL